MQNNFVQVPMSPRRLYHVMTEMIALGLTNSNLYCRSLDDMANVEHQEADQTVSLFMARVKEVEKQTGGKVTPELEMAIENDVLGRLASQSLGKTMELQPKKVKNRGPVRKVIVLKNNI